MGPMDYFGTLICPETLAAEKIFLKDRFAVFAQFQNGTHGGKRLCKAK
jgi:hypothetical protein